MAWNWEIFSHTIKGCSIYPWNLVHFPLLVSHYACKQNVMATLTTYKTSAMQQLKAWSLEPVCLSSNLGSTFYQLFDPRQILSLSVPRFSHLKVRITFIRLPRNLECQIYSNCLININRIICKVSSQTSCRNAKPSRKIAVQMAQQSYLSKL